MYVVVDSSLGGLLVDDLPKQLVYSCTDFFEIIESLLREDVAALEGLLSKIVPWTDEPTPHRKPGRSVLKSARGSMLE